MIDSDIVFTELQWRSYFILSIIHTPFFIYPKKGENSAIPPVFEYILDCLIWHYPFSLK